MVILEEKGEPLEVTKEDKPFKGVKLTKEMLKTEEYWAPVGTTKVDGERQDVMQKFKDLELSEFMDIYTTVSPAEFKEGIKVLTDPTKALEMIRSRDPGDTSSKRKTMDMLFLLAEKMTVDPDLTALEIRKAKGMIGFNIIMEVFTRAFAGVAFEETVKKVSSMIQA